MNGSQTVELRDVCRQDRKSIRTGERKDLRYIGMESIESNTGVFVEGVLSKTPDEPQANSFHFNSQHVLYGKLRPYLNKVALPQFEGKCSTEIIPLLPSNCVDRAYLAYFLRSAQTVTRISAKTAGARMPRADMDFVLGLQLPLPPINEQRRIVDILSRAEGIVWLRREAQRKAAELVPGIFIDMFGDPVTNSKGWPEHRLGDIAEVVSGVTKGRKFGERETVEVPYLRVANVQAGHIDLSLVKTIEVLPKEVEQRALQRGDVVLTEGGDFDKLGRGALWEHDIANCIHQNHVFRVRLVRSAALPEFFVTYLQARKAREYFLRSAKRTTNLASINMTQLRALPVVLPSLGAQHEFVEHFNTTRSIQSQQTSATANAEATFAALLAQAFCPAT